MNPELLYLIKVNIALIFFYVFYWLFLRKDTFYEWIRYYFLSVLVLTFTFPAIDFSDLFSTVQVQTIQQITPHFPVNVSGGEEKQFTIQGAILLLLTVGTGIMLIRLGIQIASLWRIRSKSVPGKTYHQCQIMNMQTINSPFSFFRTIYVNPELHTQEDMKTILNHEQIHVRQWHSIDIILYEILFAIFWYNPLVWLIKQTVKQNIEFYTDKQILEAGYDKRQYQHELLKVGQIPSFLGIANNFNFNHLKNRITMMNRKQSNQMQLLKFALILPLFSGMSLMANSNVSLNPKKSSQDKAIATTQVVSINEATANKIASKPQKKDKQEQAKKTTKFTAPVLPAAAQEGGTYAVNEKVHDFGTIKEKDGNVTTVFVLTNLNKEPLVINNVRTSCGCTTPEWTKEPIATGAQGHVKAIYAAAGRPGPFEKTITVDTNGSPNSISLTIKGTVVSE